MDKKIDYEKSFKKLVEQIKLETEWCSEELIKNPYPTEMLRIGATRQETKDYYDKASKSRFYTGMMSAYESIRHLAKQLEDGEFWKE
ncbi:MAG: hypothetical protein J6U54_11635 [Clostridiales bacterium]|nr:hypothetical protein [Clostridiales bacterium]